jgi:hypothetical protein
MGLQSSFFTERAFPRTKGWATSIKNKIISLLPNLPSGNDESLHKEGVLILKFSVLHHLEEFCCEVPTYSKRLPTGLAKGAAEEQMKRRILNVAAAEDTIIVISLKPLLFPSQNVSCIQSIHQEKP